MWFSFFDFSLWSFFYLVEGWRKGSGGGIFAFLVFCLESNILFVFILLIRISYVVSVKCEWVGDVVSGWVMVFCNSFLFWRECEFFGVFVLVLMGECVWMFKVS